LSGVVSRDAPYLGDLTGLDAVHAGLTITALREHDHLEWRQFRWMEPTADGQWILPSGRERLPMMFTLEALRR
jgi:hypothetical protein